MVTKLEGTHTVEYISAFLKSQCARLLVDKTDEQLARVSKRDLIENVGHKGLVPTHWVASYNDPGFKDRWVIQHSYAFGSNIDNFQNILESCVDEVLDAFSDHRETFSLDEFPVPNSRIQDGKLVYQLV